MTVPVVILHGLGGSAGDWRPLAERLAGRHAALALNLPGQGGRPAPAGPLTLADLVEDIASLLDRHGVTAAHMIGHSLGGAVTLSFALRYPQRCRSLVLIATSPEAAGAEERAALARQIAQPGDTDSRRQVARAYLTRPDLTPALAGITIPALIIAGERDTPALVRGAELLHGWMPQSRLVLLAEAGHHPQHEQPEALAEAIETFLNDVDEQPNGPAVL